MSLFINVHQPQPQPQLQQSKVSSFSIFYSLLILLFSYENHLDHFNDNNNDRDDHTQTSPTLQATRKPLNASKRRWQQQQVLETRHIRQFVCFFFLFFYALCLFLNSYDKPQQQQC
jgi:hypothetical protein